MDCSKSSSARALAQAPNSLPAPLTPPSCNLSDFQYMELDVRLLRDSRFASTPNAEAFRAGVLLWCAAWHQVPAASLPDDDAELASLAGYGRMSFSVREWKKVRDEALAGFVKCSDGRLYHPVVAEKALIAWAKKQATGRKIDRRLQIQSAEWAALRAAVFERDNYTCTYCSSHGVRLEADHIVPVRCGGETTMSNLATACLPCNRSKGAKTLSEWRA